MSTSSNENLSRRDFLKLGLAGLAALALPPGLVRAAAPLGRVTYRSLRVRAAPSFQAEIVGRVHLDDLLPLFNSALSPEKSDYNRLWYQIPGEKWVYSGGIQIVRTDWQTPVSSLPEGGALGQVSVPFVQAYWRLGGARAARLYYGSLHYVTAAENFDGKTWYRLYDDRFHVSYYADARTLHLLSPEEYAPLSPDIPNEKKWLEIDLGAQQVRAYEDDLCVRTTPCASGKRHYETPTGWFHTFHKRYSLHMVGGDGVSSFYDLLGVPWCTFVSENGVALHGAYWHNDFGAPNSHGCVNLPIEAARWVFRWTRPVIPSGKRMIYQPGQGTRVFIHS